MPITLHGIAAVPIDNGSNATTSLTITPPASMVAGDLCLIYTFQRGTGNWSVSNSGGQTWTTGVPYKNTNASVASFWCIFNGTWSSSLTVNCTAGTNTSAYMMVFRPSSGYEFNFISEHTVARLFNSTTPFASSSNGLLLSTTNNIVIAGWFSADDNTWGTLTGTGWTKTGLAAQYRNLAGNDSSASFAWRLVPDAIRPDPATQTQLTLGTDATARLTIYFHETLIPVPVTYNESVTLDSVHNLSTVGALAPKTYSRDIMFSMRTFLENESELIPGSNVYEESTILSSINLLTTTEELLANGIITLTSNNTIDVANDATVNNSVSIISNNDLSVQSNLNINGDTQLASDSTIDVTGGLDVNNSTSITADTEVDVNNDLTINQNISLITDNNVDVQSNIEASGIISLTGDGQVDVNGDLTIDSSITLQNNNTIDVNGNIDVNNSVSLESNNSIETNANSDLNNNISLSSNNFLDVNVSNDLNTSLSLSSNNIIDINSNIDATGNVILQTDNIINTVVEATLDNILILESDTDVDLLNNIDASANVSLESDGGFNEQSLADYLNSSILLSEGGIELTTEQIAELTISLLAASQLDVSVDDGEYFKLVSLQMNNQVLFDLFTEAYNSLSLLSETITTFDVVLAVSNLLELNINTDVIVEISNILDSAVSLSTVNTIQTEGEVISSGTTYNESTVLTINIDLFFVDSIEVFMKMIGALFIKNINKIIG
jgi:hypothetical protein